MFCKSKVTTLGPVVELVGPDLEDPPGGPAALAGQIGVRSTRLIQQALDHWRQLSGNECVLLRMFYRVLWF